MLGPFTDRLKESRGALSPGAWSMVSGVCSSLLSAVIKYSDQGPERWLGSLKALAGSAEGQGSVPRNCKSTHNCQVSDSSSRGPTPSPGLCQAPSIHGLYSYT